MADADGRSMFYPKKPPGPMINPSKPPKTIGVGFVEEFEFNAHVYFYLGWIR